MPRHIWLSTVCQRVETKYLSSDDISWVISFCDKPSSLKDDKPPLALKDDKPPLSLKDDKPPSLKDDDENGDKENACVGTTTARIEQESATIDRLFNRALEQLQLGHSRPLQPKENGTVRPSLNEAALTYKPGLDAGGTYQTNTRSSILLVLLSVSNFVAKKNLFPSQEIVMVDIGSGENRVCIFAEIVFPGLVGIGIECDRQRASLSAASTLAIREHYYELPITPKAYTLVKNAHVAASWATANFFFFWDKAMNPETVEGVLDNILHSFENSSEQKLLVTTIKAKRRLLNRMDEFEVVAEGNPTRLTMKSKGGSSMMYILLIRARSVIPAVPRRHIEYYLREEREHAEKNLDAHHQSVINISECHLAMEKKTRQLRNERAVYNVQSF